MGDRSENFSAADVYYCNLQVVFCEICKSPDGIIGSIFVGLMKNICGNYDDYFTCGYKY